MSRARLVLEKFWSGEVKTKWHSPEGLFDKKSSEIAAELKKDSKDLKQAMSRLNFYINRTGKNLSKERKAELEKAKVALHKLYPEE